MADARSLVATQAETVPPPEPTVPEPATPGARPGLRPTEGDLAGVVHRLKQLAEEVGGFDRLKELIDELQGP